MCKSEIIQENCSPGECGCRTEDQVEMLELNKKVLEARIKCLDRRIGKLKNS